MVVSKRLRDAGGAARIDRIAVMGRRKDAFPSAKLHDNTRSSSQFACCGTSATRHRSARPLEFSKMQALTAPRPIETLRPLPSGNHCLGICHLRLDRVLVEGLLRAGDLETGY